MQLSKEEKNQILLFEDYIESLIDLRLAQTNFPGQEHIQEEALVKLNRVLVLEEVFKHD